MLIKDLIKDLQKFESEYPYVDVRLRHRDSVSGHVQGIDRVEIGNRGVELVVRKEPDLAR